jgi:hypothetical protein
MEKNGINKVYLYNEYNNRVDFNNSLKVSIRDNESSGKFPDLLIVSRGRSKFITTDPINKVMAQHSKYDIIYVDTSFPHRSKEILHSVIILFDRYSLLF